MDLREETERIILEGYNEANAQAKLCQDIILKAISDSGMAKNATIKGGVVMRSISGNARRATQDIDIDLIRYSISNESIRAFISKLNCIEGLDIRIGGPIIELNHQDYKGKRVTITITDEHANSLSLKMDIGVHKDLDIEQDQYSFDIGFQEDAVSLLINSPAQMITEKLKSLLRFGTRSTYVISASGQTRRSCFIVWKNTSLMINLCPSITWPMFHCALSRYSAASRSYRV